MDCALEKYPNAFAIMLPGITGVGYLHRLHADSNSSVGGIHDSGISVDGLLHSYDNQYGLFVDL